MNSIANVGQTDKVIRLLAGIALIAVSFIKFGAIGTTPGVVLLVVGVVLIATALMNFCPAYKVFGLSSLKKTK